MEPPVTGPAPKTGFGQAWVDPLLLPVRAPSMVRLLERIREGGRSLVLSGPTGSAAHLCLYLIARETSGSLLVITPNDSTAERLVADLRSLATLIPPDRGEGLEVAGFPSLGTDPYQGLPVHPQSAWERVDFLCRLRKGARGIFICSVTSLLPPLMPPGVFAESMVRLKEWQDAGLDRLQARLVANGYTRVDMVTQRGEWSRRGGILDIHPAGSNHPIRVELFGDQVESIRTFDPWTQMSLDRKSEVEIPPMREFSLTSVHVERLMEILDPEDRPARETGIESRAEALRDRGYFMGAEMLAGLIYPEKHTVFDYLGSPAVVVVDRPDEVAETVTRAVAGIRQRYGEEIDPGLPPPDRIFLTAEEVLERINQADLVVDSLTDPDRPGEVYGLSSRSQGIVPGRIPELLKHLRVSLREGWWEVLVLETSGRLERLREILTEEDLPIGPVVGGESGGIFLVQGKLGEGFQIPEVRLGVYTEREIFGAARRPAPPPRRSAFHSDFRDLRPGDLVVHVEHGIGRFLGLERLPGNGNSEGEFLGLEYRAGDRLYLPIDRLDLLQRFTGSGESGPSLDRLGGKSWEKTKSKVRQAMREMAGELLELYAGRKAIPGHQFSEDSPWQRELEDAFPFEETPDQARAIEEAKRDMQDPTPMDRLVCGDVGFGKTEVALRCAFKAVMDGKQVAILVPTTVLAFQHFLTFGERFSAFPVRVEMLSRFRGPREQKAILKDLAAGRVDILIGTHRILSRDVEFPSLGLLIIDEEQRFGVTHKERIQTLRRQVDVLTMTATPIPRTLQLSLAGIRDLSMIETPPRDRLEIQTSVVPFREGILVSAIQSELARGGQIYFVHNRVESIGSMAELIRRICPGIRLGIAHGQMAERLLEKTMLAFVRGEFDLLLSTTIIENGLDIPNVNTLIVNRADRFGLAQLYQLRGRVGRSHHRAYAYLLVPSYRTLTPNARKRLKVLQEFTELGSGFRIAAMDLEIRGAGSVLGHKQHGHIASVGFETYVRLLENAVKELKGEKVVTDHRPDLNLRIEYNLPEDYVGDPHHRLFLYKKISSARTGEEMDGIRKELEDSFGRLPPQGIILFDLARLRLEANSQYLKSIDYTGGTLRFRFTDIPEGFQQRLVRRLTREPHWRLTPRGVLVVPAPGEPEDRIRIARAALKDLL